jgi:hypothetical protein
MLLAARLALMALVPAGPATAGKIKLLHSFSGGADDGQPRQKFTADSQGNLYGVSTYIHASLFEQSSIPSETVAILESGTRTGGQLSRRLQISGFQRLSV